MWAMYSRMEQVKFVEDLNRPNYYKFFKGCLLQMLLGPCLNTLPYMWSKNQKSKVSQTVTKQKL